MNKLKEKQSHTGVAIITINSTQNNTLLLAKDLVGNRIGASSLGLVLKKKRGKRSVASAAQLSSETLANYLIELGYTNLLIKVKGFGRGRESALFGFSNSELIIDEILDVTPIPHNGCRPKRIRRV
jgi:small subunit ribosomal protein S11